MTSALPSAAEKPRYVAAMFNRIAGRYDRMNALMTLGQVTSWRRALVRAVHPGVGDAVLDVGTGTGRLALDVAHSAPGAWVTAVDFAQEMLRRGRPAIQADPAGRRVVLAAADALRLPFPDEAFQVVVSAFVVRNLADVEAGLREQARVLAPGGRLGILEITPGPSPLLRPLFWLYFRGLVPLAGWLVAGDARAYTYLPESAAAFLPPHRLADLLRRIGLQDVSVRPLFMGTVAVTSGQKPGLGG